MIRKSLLLCIALLFAAQVNAQNSEATKEPGKIFTYVDRMPAPKYNLNEYLVANLRYPERARENNIEGRVIVKFIVNEKGRIRDCQITKGIGGGCDEEALRVVEAMPRWRPGKQKKPGTNRYMNIKVWYTLPIVFKLQ